MQFNIGKSKKEKSFNWFMAFLLLIFLILYTQNITGWLIHDDEGGYLYQVWRMSEGDVPYKDFYSPKEPLFLFTGYLIFKLFGPSVFWLRMFTVATTIFTAYFIFLIGKRLYYEKIAVLASLLYLFLPVVCFQARLFRSDAHVVFFSILGLFFFLKAWQDKTRSFFFLSGIFYAMALGYKLAAVLGVVTLLLFIAYQAAVERKISAFLYSFLPFVSGFLITAGVISAIVLSVSPSFLDCLMNHQLKQPLLSSINVSVTLKNNLKDFFMINYGRYGLPDTHPWLIILSLPILIRYLFIVKEEKKILTFYVFGFVVLFFSPYPGEILRYLLYFLPVAVLVFSSIVFYLFSRERPAIVRILALAVSFFILAKMLVPALMKDKVIFSAKENGTLAFAEYIKKHTADDDYVVADYGDILFHARRKTTPFMAAMSKSAVDSGVITSDKLIRELQKYRVKMILIHREGGIARDLGYYLGNPYEPHHFSALISSKDGSKFVSYFSREYQFITNYNRSGQIFGVYVRK